MNSMHKRNLKRVLLAVLMGSTLAPSWVAAAPGTIANTPLFTINSAESNIFFMVDDSRSMDLEILTPELDPDSFGWDGSLFTSGRDFRYITPDGGGVDHDGTVRWVPNEENYPGYGLWRARNYRYNFIYYNPTETYEPWVGVDSAGNAYTKYTSATATGVRIFPYSSTSNVLNLTTSKTASTGKPNSNSNANVTLYIPHYYVWDSVNDANGTVDITDTFQRINIVSGTEVCTNGLSATEQEQINGNDGDPGTGGCMLRSYADEMANFANWWAYYRRREYVSKYAMGKVIANANAVRMGMANIHLDTTYQRQIESMNTDVSSGAKNGLMDEVYSLESAQGGTPLKSALNSAGDYFACTGSDPFGFTEDCPIQSTIVSPATEASGVCQQNFTVMVTDGFYATESISGIANDDNDASSWAGTNNNNGTNYTFQFDSDPYQDGLSDSLADIAMYYYERDLDTNLANKVPTRCGIDENPGQHMVFYAVSFGLEGNINWDDLPAHPKYGYMDDCTATPNNEIVDYNGWPSTLASGTIDLIDDLLHAAYNGRGNYYSARKPEDLVTALEDALKSAYDRTGSAAAVAFNSTTLGTNSAVYLALFQSGLWSGDLESYALDANTGVISNTMTWSAATVLDTRNLSTAPRKIVTYDASLTTPAGIPFQWANLSASHKADLNTSTSGSTDTNGQSRLNYIRGDRSNEGTGLNFRIRNSRLGDIVHSGPVFVGQPQQSWPDGDDDGNLITSNGWPEGNDNHSIFRNNVQTPPLTSPVTPPGMKDRQGVVYVGANDGMLHGFKESDGSEVLAFIPNALFSTTTAEGLHYLADPSYGHRYHVDLSPTISDVYIKSRKFPATKKWRTVLISGNRAGGKGIFALDVTDPTSFDEANAGDLVLWEFTHAKLGKTFSRPTIAPTSLVDANGHYRWAAFFGNGYNNTSDGKAHLFIVFLDGGIDGVWTDGSGTSDLDYVIVSTPAGTIANSDCSDAGSDCNGLSTPAVIDIDGDSVVDMVYGGDLHGNLWAFDLTNADAANWTIAHDNTNDKPLFYAKDPGGTRQPITTVPQVAFNPEGGSNDAPNLLVMFGTGQYLADGDSATTTVQTMYAVWDNDVTGANNGGEKTRATLVAQTITNEVSDNNTVFRVLSDNDITWNNKDGWYIDLAFDSNGDSTFGAGEKKGERLITDPVLRGDTLFFNTTIPSPNPCSAGGSGWLMSVDFINGGRPDNPIFDVDGDGDVDASDVVTVSSVDYNPGGEKFDHGMPASPSFLGNKQYTPGTTTTSGDEIEQREVESLGGLGTGRLSWQEFWDN